jgi:hypothetical protein
VWGTGKRKEEEEGKEPLSRQKRRTENQYIYEKARFVVYEMGRGGGGRGGLEFDTHKI